MTADLPPDVIIDTSAAAAVRTPPGLRVFGAVYTLVYTFGVIAYIALSVYYDAFDYRSQSESSLLAAVWVLPFPIVAHLLHFVLYRSGRQRRQAIARRTATRIVSEATGAGYPLLDAWQVERMLLAEDNGPAPVHRDREGALPVPPAMGPPHRRPVLRRRRHPQRHAGEHPPQRRVVVDPESRRCRSTSNPSRCSAPRRVPVGPHRTVGVLTTRRAAQRSPTASDWPTCAEHHEPMQFTAQLERDGSLILVFICQADPGSCPSWDPDAGCNAAIVVGGRDLHPAGRPASSSGTAVMAGAPWLLGVHQAAADDYSDALAEARADGVTVAGQWGGRPAWIQNDETPDGYRFVAMLDEDPLGVNFGGGSAYVFADGHGHAKVLTQT
ncbi:hypothetical protein Q9Q99_02690 [Curtobacterium flaccumfaciens]|nr:hypothetical protein Q9Q99_02690 [Curtobacterium flaccumfaciens]